MLASTFKTFLTAGLLMIAALPIAASAAAGGVSGDQAELLKITQALADAIAPGDTAVWLRYTDARMIYVDENNAVMDRKKLIEDLKPLPPGLSGNILITDFKYQALPLGAVTTYVMEETEIIEGHTVHNRYRETDTWLHEQGRWKRVASQALAINKDPPKIALTAAQLARYAGEYWLTSDIHVTMTVEGDHLTAIRTGKPNRIFLPEADGVFFEAGFPRERRIFAPAPAEVTEFRDRREGEDIVWKKVLPQANPTPP